MYTLSVVLRCFHALDCVRQRHDLANGDLDRDRHQPRLLAAQVARATGENVPTNPVRLAQVLHAGWAHPELVWRLTG